MAIKSIKHFLILATTTALTAHGAYAGNNPFSLEQAGNNNAFSYTVTGNHNHSTNLQQGNNNIAGITVSGNVTAPSHQTTTQLSSNVGNELHLSANVDGYTMTTHQDNRGGATANSAVISAAGANHTISIRQANGGIPVEGNMLTAAAVGTNGAMVLTQAGSFNQMTVVQDGADMETVITQKGQNNRAATSIVGSFSNVMVDQTSTSAVPELGNVAWVSSVGTDNSISVEQTGANISGNSTLGVNNTSTVEQTNARGHLYAHEAYITVDNDTNVRIVQDSNASYDLGTSTPGGGMGDGGDGTPPAGPEKNYASVAIANAMGSGMAHVDIEQHGHRNSSNVSIADSGLTGTKAVTVYQDGSHNTLGAELLGGNLSSNILQNNTLAGIAGIGHTANVSLTGMDSYIDGTQHGPFELFTGITNGTDNTVDFLQRGKLGGNGNQMYVSLAGMSNRFYGRQDYAVAPGSAPSGAESNVMTAVISGSQNHVTALQTDYGIYGVGANGGNTMDIAITGDLNTFHAQQVGIRNILNARVSDTANNVNVLQRGDNSRGRLDVSGINNTLTVNDQQDNLFEVDIVGEDNTVTIAQASTRGLRDNTALVDVMGNNNTLSIAQNSHAGLAVATQTGNNNEMTLIQNAGSQSVDATQNGNNNFLHVTQNTPGDAYTVRQDGDNLTLTVIR